jgi:DNA replication factor Dna2
MKLNDYSRETALSLVKSIVRENAESLLACNLSTQEAEQEIFKFAPQIQQFANKFTEFGTKIDNKNHQATAILESHGGAKSTKFVAKSVESVEEPVISAELGLKGNVDMLVHAISTNADTNQQNSSLMGIELKTCHFQQAQHIHVVQLALYVIMLQTRYGSNESNKSHDFTISSKGGVLLYMNNETIRAIHIAPILSEIKSLIGMRNVVAIETIDSLRPRGVKIHCEESEEDPSNCNTK